MSQAAEIDRSGRLFPFSQTGERLVLCFTQMDVVADPMYYSFESFSIDKLIRHSSRSMLLNPEEKFVWREIKDGASAAACTPHYCCMSFVQVGDLVYAVGGVKLDKRRSYLYSPGNLPREFSCISLSTPLEISQAESKCPMRGGKYFPLIVEIGSLIYVLSGPLPLSRCPDIVDIGFEVYYPLEDRWEDLPDPPFLQENSYSCTFWGYFAYAVIGAKLCVSVGDYSCAYDTVHKQWEACELFSDFHPEHVINDMRPLDGCGPPFPFHGKAIPYKEDIFVCIIPTYGPSIAAFRIFDEKKAAVTPITLEGMPRGEAIDFVHLRDDYFAVLLFEEKKYGRSEYMTIVTLELLSAGRHGELRCRVVCTSTCNATQNRMAVTPIYSFKL